MSRIDELEMALHRLQAEITALQKREMTPFEERVTALELDLDGEEDGSLAAEVERLGVEMQARAGETIAIGRTIYDILNHLGMLDAIVDRRLSAVGIKRYGHMPVSPSPPS